ncbi:CBS domain-containing protein [Ferruginivarius sediminum]|uniref:CBS domain-containing protein n=1 Tax=Ferruginivarius sediminum TaxID=2661937 RepID=A0A369T6P5_9PROT|nr:CBS domain-containing protein [Ferruginivarius sediminum]RDD60562.1 CBS domain-containing protein [Ferruginivarius sediminum]
MKVSQILQTKGRDVATVSPDDAILDVVAQLKARRIGAVVALDGSGHIAGILSERDVVHALAEHGPNLAKLKVADLMTKDVTTCTPSNDVNHVMREMTQGRFRHVPVIENGKLAGLVSIGDAVKARIEELEHEREALQSYIAG